MNLRDRVRQRDWCQIVLEKLRNEHPGGVITDVDRKARYLQVCLRNEAGNLARAWMDVDVWLQEMKEALPEIPWWEVPLNYLLRWLKNLQLTFTLYGKVWDVSDITLAGGTLPKKWFSLPALPCPLMCLQWPGNEGHHESKPCIRASDVPLRVRYVLGYSQSGLQQLTEITVGDLLLIKKLAGHAAIGERHLFSFRYQQDQEVIVEALLPENYQAEDHEELLQSWSDLPVEIEFLLDTQIITLAELDKITPGEALRLNTQAEQRIKIFLNKKLFARGELVALEDGALAVEIIKVNTALVTEME